MSFLTKSTTDEEIILSALPSGISVYSFLVRSASALVVTVKDGLSGKVVFRVDTVAGDSRGFITNFKVFSIKTDLVVSLSAAQPVDIFFTCY